MNVLFAKKIAFFQMLATAVIFLIASSPALSRDFSETNHYTLLYRAQIDAYLAGRPHEMNSDFWIKTLCNMVHTEFTATEVGKVKYNDLFHEMENQEQARDIQILNDALEKITDCKARFRIWTAYDDKWYFSKRKIQDAKNKEQEKIWAAQVVDTGADVWDGVINGTFFSIPRKYMWAGRSTPDGLDTGMNLRFFFPGMEDKPTQAAAETTDLNVSLQHALVKKTFPCPDDAARDCTRYSYQTPLMAKYLDCQRQNSFPERHHALWRKACTYKEDRKSNLTPEFDDEVGMWRIGQSGYYEGSPEFPTYWFICGKPGTDWNKHYAVQTCRGAVYINDGIYAEYYFRQKQGFWHHREIHDQLQKKLRSFIVARDE